MNIFAPGPAETTAARSQTLSTPTVFFTNSDGVNSPSAALSSAAD